MNAVAGSASVREALSAATDALGAAGVDTPRLDAELMLAEAAGADRARLVAEPDLEIEPPAGRAFGAMVRRRLKREPVAYILGRKGFRNIEVAVQPNVLIPRPETEMLVDVAVELRPRTVLDAGTGSGAVALAVADELSDVRVTATDTSEVALELARDNAARLGLDGRVGFRLGSAPEGERFDLALANLPYVREEEWDGLAAEITEYEPREALVPGPTGLEAIEPFLRHIAADAVAVEFGRGQAREVAALVREAAFSDVEVRPDLAGIDRIVVGRR